MRAVGREPRIRAVESRRAEAHRLAAARRRRHDPDFIDAVFFASMTDVTCTATYLPSGLMAGAPTVLTLYQSFVSNARLASVDPACAGAAVCAADCALVSTDHGAGSDATRTTSGTAMVQKRGWLIGRKV